MGRVNKLSLLALGVIVFMGACATPRPVDRSQVPGPAAKSTWKPPTVERWSLPNGIDVWFVAQRHTSLVSLGWVLPTGSATDPRGKEGLTHLMVDMLDEGAGKRGALEVAKALERLGTDFAVETGLDSVTFRMDVLPDGFASSMAILSDILRRPIFEDDEFKRRQQLQVAENLAIEQLPRTGRARALRYAMFRDGYAGFRGKGTAATLAKLTLPDVRSHYEALVKPRGATLVVVGALAAAEVRRVVDAAFVDWTGAPSLQAPAPSPATPSAAIYLVDYPGAQQSAIAVVAPGQGADDVQGRFEKKVVARILAGAFSSRINMNLREDKGYTYGARGGFGRFRKAGYFVVGSNVRTDATLASFIEIARELKAASAERSLTQLEFDEAQTGMLLGYPNGFESIGSVATHLLSLVEMGRGPDEVVAWSDSVAKVTLSGAQAAAKPLAEMARFHLIVAGDRALIEGPLKKLGLPIHVLGRDGRPLPPPPPPSP